MDNLYGYQNGERYCSFCKQDVDNYQHHLIYCQKKPLINNNAFPSIQVEQNQIKFERMKQNYQQTNNDEIHTQNSNNMNNSLLSSRYSLTINQIPQQYLQRNEINNVNISSQLKPMQQDREQQEYNYNNKNDNNKLQNSRLSFYHPNSISSQSQQEIIKCPNCEKSLTMEQIAIHVEQCQNRNTLCQFCSELFPLSLINEHLKVCYQAQHLFNQQQELRQNRIQMIQENNQQPESIEQHSQIHHIQYSQYQSPIQSHIQFDEEESFQEQNHRRSEQDPQIELNPFEYINNLSFGLPTSRSSQRLLSERSEQRLVRMLNRQLLRTVQNVNFQRNNNQNKSGFTKDKINRFPSHKFQNRPEMNQDQLSCAICMNEFEDNENVTFLGCLHSYHSECIELWLKNKTTCPICKKDMKEFV